MAIAKTFIGIYDHKINKQGRISFPAKFRQVINEAYKSNELVFINCDTHLKIYPADEWMRKQEDLILEAKKDKKIAKALKKLTISMGYLKFDEDNGRILLPANIRESLKLNEDCVVNGSFSFIELWPKEIWEKNMEVVEEADLEDIDHLLM